MPIRWSRALPGAAAALTVAAAAVAAPNAFAAATVTPIDAAGLKRQVASHKGRVVVLNFWATWCGPCVEEFPSLVALQKKYASKGLDLVTVSFDDPKDISGKVKPFLAQKGQSKGAFINKTGNEVDEAYIKYLEPKLPADAAVAIPRTYVFDRSGKLVKTLVGGHTQADFEKAVAPYIR